VFGLWLIDALELHGLCGRPATEPCRSARQSCRCCRAAAAQHDGQYGQRLTAWRSGVGSNGISWAGVTWSSHRRAMPGADPPLGPCSARIPKRAPFFSDTTGVWPAPPIASPWTAHRAHLSCLLTHGILGDGRVRRETRVLLSTVPPNVTLDVCYRLTTGRCASRAVDGCRQLGSCLEPGGCSQYRVHIRWRDVPFRPVGK